MRKVTIFSEEGNKTAYMPMPNRHGVFYLDGVKTILESARYEIRPEDAEVMDVCLIAYNELPERFKIASLVARTENYLYDRKMQTSQSNIERMFRRLRERGKIDYEYLWKDNIYEKR